VVDAGAPDTIRTYDLGFRKTSGSEPEESFAVETTLADRSYARMIRDWRAGSYRVSIGFLALPLPGVAIARVAERVAEYIRPMYNSIRGSRSENRAIHDSHGRC